MMKYFGLLVGGLALILFASTASATTTPEIECGTGAASAIGSSVLSGTLTCPSSFFTLPPNSTLTALTFEIVDDAQDPSGVGAGVNWTWTETDGLGLGLNTVANETSTSGTTFNACTNAPGPLVCDSDISVAYTGATPTVTLTVSSAAVSGGVANNGSVSAELYIDYTYTTATTVPEPATLSLVGGALLALGFVTRKRRKA